MKKFLLGAAALVALGSAPAVAADMYIKAPPAAPAVWSWTGVYIGANGGGGWGTSRHDPTTGMSTGDFKTSGGIGGFTAGYNWQTGSFVWGFETDIDLADIKGSTHCPNPAFTCSTGDSWLGTARGRLGWTVTPNLLLYGTGGAAYGDISATVTPANVGTTGTQSATKTGWAAGGGIEWMFYRNWTAKVEYLRVDLGSFTCTPGNCGLIPAVGVKFEADIVRAGLNLKF
jgi:outer membrane immunogenic protein